MAISQKTTDALKKKYATVDTLKSSIEFSKLTPEMQKTALGAYTPDIKTMDINKDVSSGKLDVSQATIEPVKEPDTTDTPPTTVDTPTTTSTKVKTNEKGQTVGDTPDALETVRTNLTNFAADKNMASKFSTETAFKNYFGYNERSAEQKKVFDDFYKGYTADIEKQKVNQDRYNTLSTMNIMQLENITDANDLALINQDANLALKYQQAQNNVFMKQMVYGKDYNKEATPQIDGIDNIAGNYSQEYATAIGDLNTTKGEMDKIQDMIDGTYDELVKQYEGTGETESYIRAKASKINSELTNQYNDLVRKYNSQLGTVGALEASEARLKEQETAKRQERAQNLDMFNSMYGSYSDRNPEVKADPNIGKTLEIKNAKGQTIGYNQWNPVTQRYDIPTSSTSGGGAAGGVGGSGGYSVQTPAGETIQFSAGDISLFNSTKYNPQTDKDKARVARYYKFQEQQALIFSDSLANIYDILKMTKGGKSIDVQTLKSYKDLALVVDQMGKLQEVVSSAREGGLFGSKLAPIEGLIRNNNPWDTKAAEIKSRLQAIVPKLARGVYGEVGVLTDTDIKNYIQTLPNIKQTASVQDVVMLATLDTLKSGLSNNIRIDAANYDVSGLASTYKQLDEKVSALRGKVIGKSETKSTPQEDSILNWESSRGIITPTKQPVGTVVTIPKISKLTRTDKSGKKTITFKFNGKEYTSQLLADNARQAFRLASGLK